MKKKTAEISWPWYKAMFTLR